MSKLLEDVVLSIAIALGLLIGLYLSYALVVQGEHYPPTLIAVFLAIGVAALIYRFMGGLAGATFQAGLMKLGGSAAFFAAMIWFVGDRLKDEVNLYAKAQPYLDRIKDLEGERDQAQANYASEHKRFEDLRKTKTEGGGNCPAAQCTIANVKKLQPNDPFVVGVRRLVVGQVFPFVPTLREVAVHITVVAGLGSDPAFNICRKKLEELNKGVDAPKTEVQFSRSLEDGSKASVTAERSGTIGDDVCLRGNRDFDVQINCPVALKLFADRLSSCAQAASVRGATVSIGSLAD
jgi:hypothetical protein